MDLRWVKNQRGQQLMVLTEMAMGQNPVPPVNIPIPTKTDKNGVVHLSQNGTIGFEPWPNKENHTKPGWPRKPNHFTNRKSTKGQTKKLPRWESFLCQNRVTPKWVVSSMLS